MLIGLTIVSEDSGNAVIVYHELLETLMILHGNGRTTVQSLSEISD